jgi:hypothetical protein
MRGVLALLFLAGCNDNLPIASFVDKLRVLAVQASPPDAAPGTQVRLDPLVVEPEQNTSTLSALWLACATDPGASSTLPCGFGVLDGSALPDPCDTTTDGTLCTIGTDLYSLVTPTNALVGSQLLVTLVVTDDPNGAAACYLGTLKHNGLPTEPDRCVISYKRVTVSSTPSNHNPSIDQLLLVDKDGTEQSLLSGDAMTTFSPDDRHLVTHTLAALRAADSAELESDGTYEAMSLSWFTDAGAIDGGRSSFDPPDCSSQLDCDQKVPPLSATTSWKAPTTTAATAQLSSSGRMHFWAVLRDDRGGVGWHTGVLTLH